MHCVIPATRRLERVAENAAAGDPPCFDADAPEYVARLAARRPPDETRLRQDP